MNKYHQIADVLLNIELEMRRNGLWSVSKPSKEDVQSIQPFCVDTLSFSEWIQFIFIPEMKDVLEKGQHLPSCSDVAPMAEVSFKLTNKQTDTVLELLIECDRLIIEAAA